MFPAAPNWLKRLAHPQYVFAYGAQLVSFLTALSFNLVLPLQVGATTYGGFVAAFSLSFSVFALFTPGYALAAVRHLTPHVWSAQDNRLLLRWLMVPAAGAALCIMVLGRPVGLKVFSWSDAVSVYAAALVPVLAATHLLDCLLVAQNRNGLSLAGRLIVGLGVGILPWAVAKVRHSAASVLLGVLLAYVIATAFYVQVLRRVRGESVPVRATGTLRVRALVSSSLHYSAISMTGTLFSWAVLLIVSQRVTSEELAGLKIALAVPTAAVALLPFPQMFIFARLQAAASKSSGRSPRGLWVLAIATCAGVLAAAILHFVGPMAISMVYGPSFGAAAAYTGILAWMVIPQLAEQPLLAVLSTVHTASTLTPLYIAGLVMSLAVPIVGGAVFGGDAYAPGIVVGRMVSVAIPAALLLRRAGISSGSDR